MEEEVKQKTEEDKVDELVVRQEKFCQLYATDAEFFGNGVESYLEVYDIDQSKPNWYKTACAAASRLLSNVKVIARISELLESEGLNDAFIDKQLKFLITQYSDFGNKLGAIREYNKLKQRIIEKSDITSGGEPIVTILKYMDKPEIIKESNGESEKPKTDTVAPLIPTEIVPENSTRSV